jgi:hypothetical protein
VTSAGNDCGEFLCKHGVTLQWTKTWKESTDPDRNTKLAWIEHVASTAPDRVFAFDEFGPLQRCDLATVLACTHVTQRRRRTINVLRHAEQFSG